MKASVDELIDNSEKVAPPKKHASFKTRFTTFSYGNSPCPPQLYDFNPKKYLFSPGVEWWGP